MNWTLENLEKVNSSLGGGDQKSTKWLPWFYHKRCILETKTKHHSVWVNLQLKHVVRYHGWHYWNSQKKMAFCCRFYFWRHCKPLVCAFLFFVFCLKFLVWYMVFYSWRELLSYPAYSRYPLQTIYLVKFVGPNFYADG